MKNSIKLNQLTATLAGLVVIAGFASSEAFASVSESCDHRSPPPPEALEACESLSEGDECTVQFGERTIDGTCRKGPSGDGELACMPNRRP